MNHTREESHYRECMTIHEKPQLQIRFWPFKPCNLKTMGAPDFSKNWTIVLNFHAKIINTLIPVCQQTTKKWYVKRSCWTKYIFTTQHDFQTCFQLIKTCLPAIDDFNNLQAWYCTSSSKKNRLIFLMSAKKVEKRQTSWSTRKLQPCPPLLLQSRRYRDIKCATLHIRK